MSEYRFIVFSRDAGPTNAELREFYTFVDLLDRQVAYGTSRRSGEIAICIAAGPYDRLRMQSPAFDDLLLKWRVRGAEVSESLGFCKSRKEWKRLLPSTKAPSKSWPEFTPPDNRPTGAVVEDGTAAEGRALLATANLRQQNERYEQLAKWAPYILGMVFGCGLLIAGALVVFRLERSDMERRFDTIRRVAEEAASEPLRPRQAASPSDMPRTD